MDESVLTMIRSISNEYLGLSHHDRSHVERVYNLAVRIAREENADLDVVKAASLLHDVARTMEDKGIIEDHAVEGAKMACRILERVSFPESKIAAVAACIEAHRFRNGFRPKTLEAMILQDADRLDVIGAVGIARLFSRSGWENTPIHDPMIQPKEKYDGESLTSVNHIYEKVLKIKDTLNTDSAKKIAEERHKFVESFLNRLLKEWDGEL